jgi:membrane protein implicated in regulation of membrane protease activity
MMLLMVLLSLILILIEAGVTIRMHACVIGILLLLLMLLVILLLLLLILLLILVVFHYKVFSKKNIGFLFFRKTNLSANKLNYFKI